MKRTPDMEPLDPATIADIRAILSQARFGNLQAARLAGEQALLRNPGQVALQALLGALCCQSGDFGAAVRYLSPAHAANPDDTTIAINLASALIECDALAEAAIVCSEALAGKDSSGRLWRMRGFILQSTEDYAGAVRAYQRVVAAVPGDFEAWNNLGNAHADSGDVDAALTALHHAKSLEPKSAAVRLNLATVLSNAGRIDEAEKVLLALSSDYPDDAKVVVELAALHKQRGNMEQALATLAQAAELAPKDADLQVKLGLERVANWDMKGGEEALARAMAIDPGHSDAHLLTALVYEHTNRENLFDELVDSAFRLGVSHSIVQFIRALAHRRNKRWEDGLRALEQIGPEVEDAPVHHMRGQFLDRLGNADAAFAEFQAMNESLKLDLSDPVRRASEFREKLASDTTRLTDDWYARWRPTAAPAFSPVFLVGFPRSGTTLLDTMLMGHSGVEVMEEQPVLNEVEASLGGIDRLAEWDEDAIAEARQLYLKKAGEFVALDPTRLLVDKSPMQLNKAALIHRLFPNARFVLALRHPADAVLSCYITNFRLNNGMANFVDLSTSAELYDMSFRCWTQARRVLPLQVHEVKYEQVVADTATELHALCAFLGLRWDAKLMDHRQTARDRGVISTASYAQVTEPLYTRSAGRWTRYREHLAPVLPVLAPWIDRFGYSQD